MAASHDSALKRSLTTRLNMQISLSATPVVEEWMDIHMTRWMESIPLPPEMPTGHIAHFSVQLASDLSRVGWRAYGNPAGFIPKMSEYFQVSRMSQEDTALIDIIGNTLEPKLVGSWVAVAHGKLTTGWQFCDEHRFDTIAPFFGEHEAKTKLMAWMAEAGVERFCRFAQAIGDEPATKIELPVPGVSIDDQLAVVSRAFEALAGEPLPQSVDEAMSGAVVTGFSVGVRISRGRIIEVSAISPGLANDVVAKLCADTGLGFDDKHIRLQGAFGVSGPEQVEYTRSLIDANNPARIDLLLLPSDGDGSGNKPDEMN